MSFFDELRNLDIRDVGGWSKSIKTFMIVILFGLIVLLGWYFYVSDQQDDLAQAQRTEQTLKREFSAKQAKAANLAALEQQLAQMKSMLQQLLRQLPSKTEMPALLVDVSQTALAAGLQPELFQPGRENPKEFYAEEPIKLRMIGSYHQFGTFISGVASLPRVVILTMHDVSLKPVTGKGIGAGKLVLQGTVKTYRYLDEEESNKQTRRAGGGR